MYHQYGISPIQSYFMDQGVSMFSKEELTEISNKNSKKRFEEVSTRYKKYLPEIEYWMKWFAKRGYYDATIDVSFDLDDISHVRDIADEIEKYFTRQGYKSNIIPCVEPENAKECPLHDKNIPPFFFECNISWGDESFIDKYGNVFPKSTLMGCFSKKYRALFSHKKYEE